MHLKLIVSDRYRIAAYATERGECPLSIFLEGLEGSLLKDGSRMFALLENVAREGPPRDTNLVRKLVRGIFEFRKGRIRIAWFADEDRLVICSHGFIKKSKETKKSDIEKAARIRDQFIADKRAGNIRILEEEAEGEGR